MPHQPPISCGEVSEALLVTERRKDAGTQLRLRPRAPQTKPPAGVAVAHRRSAGTGGTRQRVRKGTKFGTIQVTKLDPIFEEERCKCGEKRYNDTKTCYWCRLCVGCDTKATKYNGMQGGRNICDYCYHNREKKRMPGMDFAFNPWASINEVDWLLKRKPYWLPLLKAKIDVLERLVSN